MRCTHWKIPASFSLPLIIFFSQGLAAEHDVTRDEMQALLKERDAAIIELQHAVKDLISRLDTPEMRFLLPMSFTQTISDQSAPPR